MYKRIIVKVGTGVVSKASGQLDESVLSGLVDQIVQLRDNGSEVVLVTSGAVGAGKGILPSRAVGSQVVEKQLYAAVGQVKLMSTYAELFGRHGYLCAQVLATKEDFRDDVHYENMKNCFNAMLPGGIVPVVNENDVVATTELVFTDNDELAALVVAQLNADVLVILTSTDGILDADGKTVSEVNAENAHRVEEYITDGISASGRGGMQTKFKIARQLSQSGTEVYIVNGKTSGAILDILKEASKGTHFKAEKQKTA